MKLPILIASVLSFSSGLVISKFLPDSQQAAQAHQTSEILESSLAEEREKLKSLELRINELTLALEEAKKPKQRNPLNEGPSSHTAITNPEYQPEERTGAFDFSKLSQQDQSILRELLEQKRLAKLEEIREMRATEGNTSKALNSNFERQVFDPDSSDALQTSLANLSSSDSDIFSSLIDSECRSDQCRVSFLYSANNDGESSDNNFTIDNVYQKLLQNQNYGDYFVSTDPESGITEMYIDRQL